MKNGFLKYAFAKGQSFTRFSIKRKEIWIVKTRKICCRILMKLQKYVKERNLMLTFLVNIFRFFIIVSPRIRAYLIYIRYRLIKKECINIIIKKTQMGDWFLLYMLGQNVDSMIYKELLHELARRLGYSSKDLIDF